MENNKDIGRAYKEALENYSQSPHNRVWENIEKHLDEPEKKVFPYWKIGTGLLIIIVLSLFIFNSKDIISNEDTLNSDEIININEPINSETPIFNNDTINNSITNQVSLKTNEPFINSNKELTESNTDNKSINQEKKLIVNDQVKNNTTKSSITTNSSNASFTSSNTRGNLSLNEKRDSKINTLYNNDFYNTQKRNNAVKESEALAIQSNSIMIKKPTIIGTYDLINSLNIKPKKEKEEEDIAKVISKAYVGFTYFNSFKKGYALDQSLLENTTKGGINFSFGAALIFELNKKSNISVGIGKTKLSYTIKSADSTNSSGFLINTPNFQNLSVNQNILNNIALGNFSSIDIRQEFSYLEIPIQYSYNIYNKKISLTPYGGASFLALIDNRIIAESSNGNSLVVGDANNLSDISLSFNLGIGVSYKLSEKLSIITEPVFKYHINTFNNNSSFKPFSAGLNFGVIYKF